MPSDIRTRRELEPKARCEFKSVGYFTNKCKISVLYSPSLPITVEFIGNLSVTL